jgi:phospholipid-binding lipoprotein MlaA
VSRSGWSAATTAGTCLVVCALSCSAAWAVDESPAALPSPALVAPTEVDEPSEPPTTLATDPYEKFNRKVFAFNERLDAKVVAPAAKVYRSVVPGFVRTGIDNVIGNLRDVWSLANNALQGKFDGAARMTMRVVTNTVLGVGGLMDWASEMGLDRETEDFGQTLGRWGVPSGPYLVLPLLGSSTVRDTAATPLDTYFGPSRFVSGTVPAAEFTALQIVSLRANLLGATELLDGIALDKYSFFRDLYLSRRLNQVYDGNPPEVPEPSDTSPR